MKKLTLALLLLATTTWAQSEGGDQTFPPSGTDQPELVVGLPPPPPLPASANLIHYWDLNEPTGATRVDSVGSNDLIEGGTGDMTVTTGIHGAGVQSNFNACLQGTLVPLDGSGWTVSIWTHNLTGGGVSALNNGQLSFTRTDLPDFGGEAVVVTVIGATGLSCVLDKVPADYVPGTPFMVTAWYSPGARRMRCKVNDGPIVQSSKVSMPTLTGILTVGNSGSCTFGFGPTFTDDVRMWDREVDPAIIDELYQTVYEQYQPIHHWTLDGGYGDRWRFDAAWNFVPGLGTPTFQPGVYDEASEFIQSTAGHLQVGSQTATTIDGGGSFSATGWLYHDSGASFSASVLYYRTSGNGWFLDTNDAQNESEFVVIGTVGQHSAPGPEFKGTGTWAFFAGTWDDTGEVSKLYIGINGAALTVVTGSPEFSWSGDRILNKTEIASAMFPVGTGRVDDLRIFDFVLTQAQIQTMYDEGKEVLGLP